MIKIKVSEKRNPTPQELKIGENAGLKTWGAIRVGKSHFFPSSFQLRSGEKFIYIDPVGVDSPERADFILITHSHPDHLSLKDIKKLMKPETQILCSKSASKKLKDFANQVQIMIPGDSLHLSGLNFEATAAYNTKPVFLWIKAHPKSKGNVGYILTLHNGVKIYHAGDTDYVPEMRQVTNINVALIPIGGDNLTMNADEAALILNKIRPEKVVPIHYELKCIEALKKFRSLIDNPIEVIEMH